jgi:acetyl esterase
MSAEPASYQSLDPDARRVLGRIHAPGVPNVADMTPEAARAGYATSRKATMAAPMQVEACREISLPGPRGPVAARLYRPARTTGAGLVYLHGGGWVLGSLDTHDGLCRRLACASGATVISVDYALAPDAPFPAGLEDCIAAFRAVQSRATEFGMERDRIAIGGDSAGGNLAVAVALTQAEAGEPMPAALLLLYPAFDLTMSSPSHAEFGADHYLTAEMQRWCRGHYLAGGGDPHDWRVSPLFAPSLAGLPPAIILTASHDPLRDEAESFARRMVETGVPVMLWRINGQIHGFLLMDAEMRVVPEIMVRTGTALRLAIARS